MCVKLLTRNVHVYLRKVFILIFWNYVFGKFYVEASYLLEWVNSYVLIEYRIYEYMNIYFFL